MPVIVPSELVVLVSICGKQEYKRSCGKKSGGGESQDYRDRGSFTETRSLCWVVDLSIRSGDMKLTLQARSPLLTLCRSVT